MQDLQLLQQAHDRSLRLLEDLRRQQLELLRRDDLAAAETGRQAARQSVDALARMVDSMRQALRSAAAPGPGRDNP